MNNIKIKSSRLFAVVLGQYEGVDEAEAVAIGSTIQGASGYVWQSDCFYVVGNIYPKYEDAEIVVENLKNKEFKEIYAIL